MGFFVGCFTVVYLFWALVAQNTFEAFCCEQWKHLFSITLEFSSPSFNRKTSCSPPTLPRLSSLSLFVSSASYRHYYQNNYNSMTCFFKSDSRSWISALMDSDMVFKSWWYLYLYQPSLNISSQWLKMCFEERWQAVWSRTFCSMLFVTTWSLSHLVSITPFAPCSQLTRWHCFSCPIDPRDSIATVISALGLDTISTSLLLQSGNSYLQNNFLYSPLPLSILVLPIIRSLSSLHSNVSLVIVTLN